MVRTSNYVIRKKRPPPPLKADRIPMNIVASTINDNEISNLLGPHAGDAFPPQNRLTPAPFFH